MKLTTLFLVLFTFGNLYGQTNLAKPFEECGLQGRRIDTGVFAFNKASCRVLEKCGFELEGIFKNSIIKNGIVVDELRFGIIN